jgi:hypothetical protein
MIAFHETATVPETYRRLHAEGHNISMCALRRWVRTSVLPATYAGQNALLYYPNVIRPLQEGNRPQSAS